MHLQPSYGKGRAVGEAIVSTMFTDGDDGRIPVVAVSGTNGKTTTVRLITHIRHQRPAHGHDRHRWRLHPGERIDTGDCSGPRSARSVLLHPDVDAAVFETARGGLLREASAFDRCDVAVVTNVGEGDHLPVLYQHGGRPRRAQERDRAERGAARHGRAQCRRPDGRAHGRRLPGSVTFFARDPQEPAMATHRARGKRVVFVDGQEIVAAEGDKEVRIAFSDMPLTRGGSIGFRVENAMASVAAAWALGVDWNVVRQGLMHFDSDAQTAPDASMCSTTRVPR